MQKNQTLKNKPKNPKHLIAKDILKMYDKNSVFLSIFAPKTKGFTKLIDAFEIHLNIIKIAKEVDDEIKKMHCRNL